MQRYLPIVVLLCAFLWQGVAASGVVRPSSQHVRHHQHHNHAAHSHHQHHHHHHGQQQQNVTISFYSNVSPTYGNPLGYTTAPPGACFPLSNLVEEPLINSAWIDFKNTTDQWVIWLYSDTECSTGSFGIEGYGIGGLAYGSTLIAALSSAPIITEYTSSWGQGSPWNNDVPYMNGIVQDECESWLSPPTIDNWSWKYNIIEANNTWQYYEYHNSSECQGEASVFYTAQVGSGDINQMVVSKTNDYTCAGDTWGSCPPNKTCVDNNDNFACQ